MHGKNAHQNPPRTRRRKALDVLAVVVWGYGVYQLFGQLRTRRQPADTTSLPTASTLPTATSLPTASTLSPASTMPSASSVMSQAASPSLGEHSVWLETFRAEQVQRLRSDPPAA